jgi:hypothetical protein
MDSAEPDPGLLGQRFPQQFVFKFFQPAIVPIIPNHSPPLCAFHVPQHKSEYRIIRPIAFGALLIIDVGVFLHGSLFLKPGSRRIRKEPKMTCPYPGQAIGKRFSDLVRASKPIFGLSTTVVSAPAKTRLAGSPLGRTVPNATDMVPGIWPAGKPRRRGAKSPRPSFSGRLSREASILI